MQPRQNPALFDVDYPPWEPGQPKPHFRLIDSDGIPMDSPWHRAQMHFLIAIVVFWWRAREDFYVGGDMFVYYSVAQARELATDPEGSRAYRGPDFFLIKGVKASPDRRSWKVWNEGNRYPDLIIELQSPSTARVDRTTKKTLYERVFRTAEYFIFDPDSLFLVGWRLGPKGRYRKIPADERGWLWSEELQLWLGLWQGAFLAKERTWLRFFDAHGQLVPYGEEAERQRAEAAEAELALLRARLKKQEGNGAQP